MTNWKRSSNQIRVSVLETMFRGDQLNLRPPYQRGAVWSKSMEQAFIWSLLNNLAVGQVYVHVKPRKRGPVLYDVIDGQQRLNALFRFLDGKFSLPRHAKDESLLHVGEIKVAGMRFKQLPDELANLITNYDMDVVMIESTDLRRVVLQFVRLQMSRPLTSQEKREAFVSPLADAVDRLAEQRVWKRVQFRKGRSDSSIRQGVARILVWEKTGRVVDTGTQKLDSFYLGARIGLMTSTEVEKINVDVATALSWLDVVVSDIKSPINVSQLLPLYIFLRSEMPGGALKEPNLPEMRKWYSSFTDTAITKSRGFWANGMDKATHVNECVELLRNHYYKHKAIALPARNTKAAASSPGEWSGSGASK